MTAVRAVSVTYRRDVPNTNGAELLFAIDEVIDRVPEPDGREIVPLYPFVAGMATDSAHGP